MEALSTPEERFADLPDYPFEPNYAEIRDGEGGIRFGSAQSTR